MTDTLIKDLTGIAAGLGLTDNFEVQRLASTTSTEKATFNDLATLLSTLYALRSNNLSDLASAATARANLGFNQPARNAYVSGNWYFPDNTKINGGAGATFASATTLKAIPILIRKATTITDLGASVNTGNAGDNIQLALYAADATTGLPTGSALSNTANVSAAAGGRVSGALGASQAVVPGMYWLAMECSSVTPVMAGIDLATPGLYMTEIGNSSLTTAWSLSGTAASGVSTTTGVTSFGTWPSLTAASFTAISNAPFIAFKVS